MLRPDTNRYIVHFLFQDPHGTTYVSISRRDRGSASFESTAKGFNENLRSSILENKRSRNVFFNRYVTGLVVYRWKRRLIIDVLVTAYRREIGILIELKLLGRNGGQESNETGRIKDSRVQYFGSSELSPQSFSPSQYLSWATQFPVPHRYSDGLQMECK